MNFVIQKNKKIEFLKHKFKNLYVIGYAGRDEKKTLKHIQELQRDLNVEPPKQIPTIFECSKRILTNKKSLDVFGGKNSGEAEYVIVLSKNKIYIGLGSDHTDRSLESYNVAKSKEIMPKVISKTLWDYDEIKGHFDDIKLLSYQKKGNKEFAYQRGTLGEILPPKRILKELKQRVGNVDNSIIFSGTVALLDKFYFGNFFKAKMVDEKLNRTIELRYNINFITEEER